MEDIILCNGQKLSEVENEIMMLNKKLLNEKLTKKEFYNTIEILEHCEFVICMSMRWNINRARL